MTKSRKRIALHWQIIIGMVLGMIWAVLSVSNGWNDFTQDWIDPWGDIFVNALKLIALPLVFLSIVMGVSSLTDITKLGRIGGKTLGAYLVTTVFAVSIGLALVNIVKPGSFANDSVLAKNRISYELWVESKEEVDYQPGDKLRMSVDPKYAELKKEALAKNEENEAETKETLEAKKADPQKQKDAPPLQPMVDIVPSNFFKAFTAGAMLQIIFIAIFFGICMGMIQQEKSQAVLKVIDGLNDIFIAMVNVIMKGAPFFVFALMASKMSSMAKDTNELVEVFESLGWYSLTVVAGLVTMAFIVYPLLMKFFVKGMTFKKFFAGIKNAQITAFSTSSSAATLPVTIDCVNNGLGVSKRISDFVLPIGATVNMDGTSLYQAIAVVFLAQFHLIDLDMTTQLTIVSMATLASIGSAAVPGAGLIMLILILESVGLNPAWIAIILPVDRLLDMCRTVVNVTGDATVSTVIAQSEGELNVK